MPRRSLMSAPSPTAAPSGFMAIGDRHFRLPRLNTNYKTETQKRKGGATGSPSPAVQNLALSLSRRERISDSLSVGPRSPCDERKNVTSQYIHILHIIYNIIYIYIYI